jgi:hypothetical protein
MSRKRYQKIAAQVLIINGATNQDHIFMAEERLDGLMSDAPRGSGFDAGTSIDFDASNKDRLVFTTEFHHMDDNGFYDGWTDHRVIVKPDLLFGFSLRITGRNKRDIKDHIGDVFHTWLSEEVEI